MRSGEVSDTILIIGVLIIVSLTVSSAFIALDRVQLPKDVKQEVQGSNESVASKLSSLVDSCWQKSNKGQHEKVIDCFDVKVRSNGEVAREMVSKELSVIEPDRFGQDKTIPSGESSVIISYRPVRQTVNISIKDVCRVDEGEDCLDISCSCTTACAPNFDPDGDGTMENDSKGCVTSYSFEPAEGPFTSLNWQQGSIYTELTPSDSKVDVEKLGNVTLINATLKNFTTSYEKEVRLQSQSLTSPFEVIGHGSRKRKLFTDTASLDISGFSTGNYGLYLWSCSYGGLPRNCSWNPYNFTIS